MDRNTKITLLALLLLAAQAGGSQAAQTTFTTTAGISAGGTFSVDLLLVPAVANADELVSINNGTFSDGGEYGNFSISAKFDKLPTIKLYSFTATTIGSVQFSALPVFNFPLGNVTDLLFAYDSFDGQLTIPSGTVLTFRTSAAAIPEPMSLAVLGVGVAGVLGARRRTRD